MLANQDHRSNDDHEAALVAAALEKLNRWRQLYALWQATWQPAMETVIFVEQLELGEHDDCFGDREGRAPTVDRAWNWCWAGWGYRWNGGTVLTGVRADEGDQLTLIVRAVDRLNRAVSRLDEIADGWMRDCTGWLAFRTGIPADAAGFELEPLRAAALNMAAQIAWLSR